MFLVSVCCFHECQCWLLQRPPRPRRTRPFSWFFFFSLLFLFYYIILYSLSLFIYIHVYILLFTIQHQRFQSVCWVSFLNFLEIFIIVCIQSICCFMLVRNILWKIVTPSTLLRYFFILFYLYVSSFNLLKAIELTRYKQCKVMPTPSYPS